MTQAPETPQLPFAQPDPLALPPMVRALQTERPITRVRTPVGDPAWLVTRYAETRALFADPRMGRSHPDPASASRISESVFFGDAVPGFDTELEDHAKMRSRLVPCFSAHRMKSLKPRIEGLVDGLLDQLAAAPQPADLHQALAIPLPALVISELLGVPYTDRDQFAEWSEGIAEMNDNKQSEESLAKLFNYMRELVVRKRAEGLDPSSDVIAELIAAEDGGMSDDEIAFLASILLFASNETTVTRIDMGTLLFLANPAQLAALRADPALVAGAVEEVVRLSVGGVIGGIPRYARADIEIGGVTIGAGDLVLLGIGAANQDGAVFPDPGRVDLARDRTTGHLGFGHGIWYCVGATLARIELTAAFERLFTRFPGLRLAVPVDELPWRADLFTGGLTGMPVTW